MDQNTFKALLSELDVEIAALKKSASRKLVQILAAAEIRRRTRKTQYRRPGVAARTRGGMGGDRRAGWAATRAAFYTGPIAAHRRLPCRQRRPFCEAEDLASYRCVRSDLGHRLSSAQSTAAVPRVSSISMARRRLAHAEQAGPTLCPRRNQINLHFLIEVLKRVFADREAHVTTPLFMQTAPSAAGPRFYRRPLASIA